VHIAREMQLSLATVVQVRQYIGDLRTHVPVGGIEDITEARNICRSCSDAFSLEFWYSTTRTQLRMLGFNLTPAVCDFGRLAAEIRARFGHEDGKVEDGVAPF